MDENRMDSAGKTKDAIGFLLLFLGAGIALWAFLTAYGIFNEPGKLAPFQDLVSRRLESTFATDTEQVKLVIPPELLAYIVPLALLSIIVGIAGCS